MANGGWDCLHYENNQDNGYVRQYQPRHKKSLKGCTSGVKERKKKSRFFLLPARKIAFFRPTCSRTRLPPPPHPSSPPGHSPPPCSSVASFETCRAGGSRTRRGKTECSRCTSRWKLPADERKKEKVTHFRGESPPGEKKSFYIRIYANFEISYLKEVEGYIESDDFRK